MSGLEPMVSPCSSKHYQFNIMMSVLRKIMRYALPSRISNVIGALFVFVICSVITHSITPPPSSEIGGQIASIALLGIGASSLIALLSYYIPDFIIKNTSLPTLFLWIVICLGFFYASLLQSPTQFGLGCVAAVTSLFLLFIVFHLTGLFSAIDFDSPEINPEGAIVLVQGLSVALVIACAISITVTSVIAFVDIGIATSVYASTVLHLVPFLWWFIITLVVSSIQPTL